MVCSTAAPRYSRPSFVGVSSDHLTAQSASAGRLLGFAKQSNALFAKPVLTWRVFVVLVVFEPFGLLRAVREKEKTITSLAGMRRPAPGQSKRTERNRGKDGGRQKKE